MSDAAEPSHPADLGTSCELKSEAHHGSAQPAAMYLAERTPASRQTMATALKTLVDLLQEEGSAGALAGEECYLTFPWTELRRAHTLQLREKLRQRYAPATANKLLVY